MVSLTVMLFEILITRILSVTLSYHFAFLAISIAMLGLAAPGAWLSVAPPGPRALARALLASALAIPATVLLIVHVGASVRDVIAAWVAFLLVPMLALGSSVCILLLEATGTRVGKMYAADLGGAALGAVLAVPLLSGLPTPVVVAGLGLLPLVALVLVDRRSWPVCAILGLAFAGSVAWGKPYQLRYTRFYVEKRAPLFERWTPTARITVLGGSHWNGKFDGWGQGEGWKGAPPEYLWIDQDGNAGTPILHFKAGSPYPAHLPFDVTAAPYELGLGPRACIIGGGGGKDILTALGAGATDVEVVELNPQIVRAVSRDFGSYSGDPYHLPGVSAFVGEGRNHFSRVTRACDVLQISQIDTFAASSAGAYALTENSLYTIEAIRSFWSRLTPRGVLSISRWVRGPNWPESVRLVLMAAEALGQEGIAEPRAHMVVLASAGTANTLIFRSAVTPEQLADISAIRKRRGFEQLWPPTGGATDRSPIAAALVVGAAPFEADGFDVSAPTDNRPFFFQTLNLLHGADSAAAKATGGREQSVSLLRRLAIIVSAATVLLFFLPMLARGRLPRGPGLLGRTTFFASIGVAFMFVEIPLVQRLTLYLGHPSYATTVVLGALLLGAGIGASVAKRVSGEKARLVASAVPLAVGLVAFGLTLVVVPVTIFASFAARASIAALSVGALGVPMGLLFPLGMSHSDGRERSWYWAINGAASVLASVLALVLALLGGFSLVLGLAVAMYTLAALHLPRPARATT
jgi:hypothetical protein